MGFPSASAAAAYDGPVRGALLAHKERGRLALAGELGRLLAAAVRVLDDTNTGTDPDTGADRSQSAGTFMEWAVGKQGEMMRPDTGKLLLPGSKFRWDIHYSQAGEEITNKVEMGIYFYPKGQEPKHRNTLSLVPAALGTLDIRPNTVAVAEGYTTLREAAG